VDSVNGQTGVVVLDADDIDDTSTTNKFATAAELAQIATNEDNISSGWIPYSAVTPTRTSADDPTYVIQFAGVDLTGIMSVGMRVKWTQNSTVRYGIVTAIAFSTNTTVTIYGGTDYDVEDTGTHTISGIHYSNVKAPFGFPMDKDKWMVKVTDTTGRSQASPTQNQWYNLGSISIVVPIGKWDIDYSVHAYANKNPAVNIAVWATLSNANNTEWDNELTTYGYIQGASGNLGVVAGVGRSKHLSFASKTTLYLNAKTSTASVTSILFDNSSIAEVIRAVCAYLWRVRGSSPVRRSRYPCRSSVRNSLR
jgi:hypothetical protein